MQLFLYIKTEKAGMLGICLKKKKKEGGECVIQGLFQMQRPWVWYRRVCAQLLHCVRLFVATWTVAHQTPLSMGFSRQGYWSGLPFPSPRDLPWPRDWICVSMSLALAGRFSTTSTTWEDAWFITGTWPYTITIIG